MNKIISLSFVACLILSSAAAEAEINVIPRPTKVELRQGSFVLTGAGVLCVDSALQAYVCVTLGLHSATSSRDAAVELLQDPARADLGTEGYELTVAGDGIRAQAAGPVGLFYAIQTLRQLISADGIAPACRIIDRPRFVYRGLMLDSSRHMQPKDYIKRFIDRMAELKLNRFHWHLSDDPGWRIEIEKYPKLTEVGAWRTHGGERYGGYYSQEDIREIVRFAASRFVTIVPEIDMPAHTTAAVASYPWLGCTGKSVPVCWAPWTSNAVFCAGNEQTYRFCEDVLTELMRLFPESPVIHTGGDECNKAQWRKCPVCQAKIRELGLADETALQGYFTARLARFIKAQGRRMQGWNEIRKGTNLPSDIIVQEWNDPRAAVESVEAGLDVVRSPGDFCYFDHTYRALPTRKVLEYEPIPADLKNELTGHILGPQANVWTETLVTTADVDRMTYPRALAFAEVAWSAKGPKDWDSFQMRALAWIDRQPAGERPGLRARLLGQFDVGVQVGSWGPDNIATKLTEHSWDVGASVNAPGIYEVTFEHHAGRWLYIEEASIEPDGSTDRHTGYTTVVESENTYRIVLTDFKPGTTYTLRASVRSAGGTESEGAIYLKKVK